MGDKVSKKRHYLQGLKVATSGNAQAFGFSILITVSYGIAAAATPAPSFTEQIAFAIAAVAAFSFLNLLVAYLARGEPGDLHNKRILLVAAATDFVAVGAGVCVAFGVSRVAAGLAAWTLIPFCAGLTYLLVQAIELALARDVDES